MCESNVYLLKSGREELLMEKVDRLIPGEDGTIFLENVFGERRSVKAQIKEMELVRHRIVLSEAAENLIENQVGEWWLEPLTDHGHFHDGEEVKLRLCWGSNLKAQTGNTKLPQVFQYEDGERRAVAVDADEGELLINIGESANGVITVCAQDLQPDIDYYAKMVVEIGHHDHHELHPVGLPLEIIP
ncbi:MAG: CooT family nickel-binding protein, partial [Methylocystaceae bacterium]